jgi:TolB protein
MKKTIPLLLCSILLLNACKKDTPSGPATGGNTSTGWTGKLTFEFAGDDVKQYTFASKKEEVLFTGGDPQRLPSGQVVYINQEFPGQGLILKMRSADYSQASTLLDFTQGEIGGYMYDPQVSPDGRYVAFTVTSYSGYSVPNDAVLVYTMNGQLKARIDSLYTPTWTPDGRLVVCGSFTSYTSAPSKPDKAGIYLTDTTFTQLTRIDPSLDDPAPYQSAVSPDGKKVAFVLNKHVWLMDINGSNKRQLTAVDNDNEEFYPRWSPDGKHIAVWSYKTFEESYYTAIAIVSTEGTAPVVLSNTAAVWPRDGNGYRISGGFSQITWVK